MGPPAAEAGNWLRVVHRGKETIATGDHVITIGRNPNSDIPCALMIVSSTHVVLRKQPEGWVVEDQASSNGTYVNGERITSVVVTGPMSLRLGDPEIGELIDLAPVPKSVERLARSLGGPQARMVNPQQSLMAHLVHDLDFDSDDDEGR